MSNELIANDSVYILKKNTREAQKYNAYFKLNLKYQPQ